MFLFFALVLCTLAWIGHACICTAVLNNLYGRPLPKTFLKLWRYATGVVILAFPLVYFALPDLRSWRLLPSGDWFPGMAGYVLYGYLLLGLVFGALVLPVITVVRLLRKPPACVVSETTRTLDLWPELGDHLIGDGKLRVLARLPGNDVFRLDVVELTLALPHGPVAWDGLSLLLLSDLHFHGTPSRVYFDRVLDELLAAPVPDLVCLVGDYVDTDVHRAWIGPILGRLTAQEAKLAILGNHDGYHEPADIRAELTAAGYLVLGNDWRQITVRGVPCIVVGHEGPWFAPPPDLSGAPAGSFRLCLSHTPDNFYWGQEHDIGLMLCGHVHGGAIRVPGIGPIFVPSVYGRRFDQGVFQQNRTVMVVSRGISGQEPIRFQCKPQAIRIILKLR